MQKIFSSCNIFAAGNSSGIRRGTSHLVLSKKKPV
jgi:hypothetical protein